MPAKNGRRNGRRPPQTSSIAKSKMTAQSNSKITAHSIVGLSKQRAAMRERRKRQDLGTQEFAARPATRSNNPSIKFVEEQDLLELIANLSNNATFKTFHHHTGSDAYDVEVLAYLGRWSVSCCFLTDD